MFKVGDIVFVMAEITDVHPGSERPYFVSPCFYNINWVSEDKIIPADKTYVDGLTDAWELARKIVCAKGFNMDELDVIFGERTADGVLKKYTVEEALAKIEAYEKEKEIKVGDEVRTEDGSTYWIIAINDYCIFGYASGKNDICFPVQKLEGLNLTKTGRTTDAIDLLRQIGE